VSPARQRARLRLGAEQYKTGGKQREIAKINKKANYETNPTSILFSTNHINRGEKIGAQLSPRGTNGTRLRCD
jgi:hypothetical protein